MLAICEQRLAGEPAAVRAAAELVRADMRDFSIAGRFHLAMFPFRSFQHLLTVSDRIDCLRSVHDHLEPAGRVIVDVFNPPLDALAARRDGQEVGEEPAFIPPDGRRVVRKHKLVTHDRAAQTNHVEIIYEVTHTDGREERIVQDFLMRYLFRYELEHLLARCGFALEAVHAGYDGDPYGSAYPGELIAVARRES